MIEDKLINFGVLAISRTFTSVYILRPVSSTKTKFSKLFLRFYRQTSIIAHKNIYAIIAHTISNTNI